MARYSDGRWPAYVPVAKRRHQAAKKIAKLERAGRKLSPIAVTGRNITTTFWGDAWCRNLESYSDYENRLPRGRTYVRTGAVIDLQTKARRVDALVSGSEFYKVRIQVERLATKRWTAIKQECAGQISSLVELLQGKLSENVMEIVTRNDDGLFPAPEDIEVDCSCLDWATMCKHVAATLYGVGARMDHDPELIFTLRGVDPAELVESAMNREPPHREPCQGRVLANEGLSSIFGVEIDANDDGATPARTPPPTKLARKSEVGAAKAIAKRSISQESPTKKAKKATAKRTTAKKARKATAKRTTAGKARKATVRKAQNASTKKPKARKAKKAPARKATASSSRTTVKKAQKVSSKKATKRSSTR